MPDGTPGWVGLVRAVQLRVAMAALVGMMLVTVADVFIRYVAHRTIEGAYDVVQACLAVFVFFGVASTFIGRRNIGIDLVDNALPRTAVAGLVRMADVRSVLCLVMIGWAMVDPALQVLEYSDTKPQLGLKLAYLWLAAMVGLVGTAVSALGAMLSPALAGMGTHQGTGER